MIRAGAARDDYGLRVHLDAVHARLQVTQRRYEIPDPLLYADYSDVWPEVREDLIARVDNDDYCPAQVEVIDLPKDVLAVRPLVRMSLIDQLLYEACVVSLQPELDRQVSTSVYSYRWRYRDADLQHPVASWLRMQKRGRRQHKRYPDQLLAKTDVSSFYEHVDVRILTDELTSLLGDRPVIALLKRFLEDFADQNQIWGLPQGSEASGSLANIYLLPIDRHLRDSRSTYLRYSDDIMIFGDSWSELRGHLLSITQILRGRRLHLAASKTRIVLGSDVLGEFEETEKDAIKYGIDVGFAGTTRQLHDLFERAVQSRGSVRARDLKFCLTQLAKIGDDSAVRWLLDNMDAVPHVALEVTRYLSRFRGTHAEIGIEAGRLLADDVLCSYPYAEMHLLKLLLTDPHMAPRQMGSTVWRLLEDRNRPGFVREYAARYAGRIRRPGDEARLRRLLNTEHDVRLRRMLMVAIYESGGSTAGWLDSPVYRSSNLSITAAYLRASPTIPLPRN